VGAAHPGAGRIRGERYDRGNYPGAVTVNTNGGWIAGDVYRLHQPLPLPPVLDEYEDFDPAAPETGEYRRVVCPVEMQGGMTLACWVTVHNRPTRGRNRIPGGDYFRGADGGVHAGPEGETERPDRD
jgi:gamma-glutamylcyclotransferase (GGCT)/AIG2-like uncharacterized protein YtfP